MKKWNLVIGKETKARVLSVLLAVTMSMSLFGCGKTASDESAEAASTAAEQVEQETAKQEKADGVSHSSESGKDETVYVIADAAGSPTKVIVSDQLKNKDGADSLKDTTTLKDITNVNGDGSYKENADGTITWDTDGGADVYYQGTTDQELPVTVKLSYQLDGKDIKPEDLAGKSGHVKIRFEYTNNATKKVKVGNKEEEIKVPFCMTSGAVLPNDTFSNVTVTNGRIINEGKNNIVVGVAFPGLTESLDWDNMKSKAKDEEARKKLDDIDIPESVEIEADVKNFALDMTLTMASSNVLSSFNLTKDIDTSEISDQMNDLQDGMDKLIDGGEDLKDGTGKVKDGASDLNDGAGKLKDGTDDLKDGAGKLKDGTSELKNGAGELADGTQSLADGAGKLQSGAQELANGTTTLKSGSSALVSGVEKLKSGTESLNSGVGKLQSGAGTLKAGTASLVENSGKLQAGAKQVDDGAGQVQAGVTALGTGVDQLKAGSTELSHGLGQLNAVTSTLTKKQADGMRDGLATLITGLYKVQYVMNTVKDSIGDSDTVSANASTLRSGMAQISKQTGQIQSQADEASNSLKTVNEYLTVTAEKSDLSALKNMLETSIKDVQDKQNNLKPYDKNVNDDTVAKKKSALDAATSDYQKAAMAYADAHAKYQAAQLMESSTPSAAKKMTPAAADVSADASAGAAEVAGSESTKNTGSENAAQQSADASGAASTGIPASSAEGSEGTASGQETSGNGDSTPEQTENGNSKLNAAVENTPQTENAVTAVTVTAEESPEIDASVTTDDESAKTAMSKAAQNLGQAQADYAKAVQDNETRKAAEALDAQAEKLDAALKQLENIQPDASTELSKAMNATVKAQSDVASISTEAQILTTLEANERAGLESVFKTLDDASGQIGTSLTDNKETIQTAVQQVGQLPVLSASVSQLYAGAQQLDAGIGKLQSEGVKQLTDGTGALKNGTSQVYSGTQALTVGAGKLDSGASQLKDGLDTLAKGAGDLDSGAGTLKTGAGQLDEGIGKVQSGAATLSTGTSDLKSGADKVNEGAGSLKTGADKLDSGTADLYDGAVQLDDGASDLYDGTVQLLDGTDSLDDGAQELLDGLNKYNKEGIQKLTELFGDNVQDVLDRLQAVTEAGDDYNSFSGALPVQSGDDKNGGNAVKFIYRTDSIKAD